MINRWDWHDFCLSTKAGHLYLWGLAAERTAYGLKRHFPDRDTMPGRGRFAGYPNKQTEEQALHLFASLDTDRTTRFCPKARIGLPGPDPWFYLPGGHSLERPRPSARPRSFQQHDGPDFSLWCQEGGLRKSRR
jgi:hypothetical protein